MVTPHLIFLSYLPKTTGKQSLIREHTYTTCPFFAREAEELSLVSKIVEGGRDDADEVVIQLWNWPSL